VEKLTSTSRDRGNLQICLGKPICSSCYDDDDYETLHLESDHLEVDFPWYSCDCLHSFVCGECYDQARTEGKQLCQRCDGNGKRLMECTCAECTGYHAPCPSKCGRPCHECLKNYKRSEKVNDIKLDVDKDFNDFFVNTVDWTKNSGFFEELGISYSNALDQMIIQVLKYWNVSPAPILMLWTRSWTKECWK
jgi:RecJ-like exonuclease